VSEVARDAVAFTWKQSLTRAGGPLPPDFLNGVGDVKFRADQPVAKTGAIVRVQQSLSFGSPTAR